MATKRKVKTTQKVGYRFGEVVDESNLDVVLEHELSGRAAKLCAQYVEAAGYTTTALFGIAQFLDESGDEEGAEMLNKFLKDFAKHEADRL